MYRCFFGPISSFSFELYYKLYGQRLDQGFITFYKSQATRVYKWKPLCTMHHFFPIRLACPGKQSASTLLRITNTFTGMASIVIYTIDTISSCSSFAKALSYQIQKGVHHDQLILNHIQNTFTYQCILPPPTFSRSLVSLNGERCLTLSMYLEHK